MRVCMRGCLSWPHVTGAQVCCLPCQCCVAFNAPPLVARSQVWHSAGLWRDHFAQPRKLLFAVLSGRMGEAAAALQLDWGRALGVALW